LVECFPLIFERFPLTSSRTVDWLTPSAFAACRWLTPLWRRRCAGTAHGFGGGFTASFGAFCARTVCLPMRPGAAVLAAIRADNARNSGIISAADNTLDRRILLPHLIGDEG
jgi:hypothetical protein